ncbi:TRAP transporter small permease [Tropicimonas marinistellae]|uniref:TRAP transporter small permease n=1 Tax=Tropicimonas marinistellae TaxID=1739787 RepID=UPI00082F9D05|nr:TRAP transporter small permease [Tropicimonas marinistellae]
MHNLAERISTGWALLGGVVIVAIMLVTSFNIGAFTLDRVAGAFGANIKGLPGYEDFVRLVLSCAALMFFPYTQFRRGHVTVDLFMTMLPPVVGRQLERLWLFAIGCLALFLAYWMTLGMVETRSDNASSPILGWAEWPFYIPGILSLFLWAFVAFVQSWEGGTDA